MKGIDPKSFEFAVSKIEDGFIFENFASMYLSEILGYKFMPVGGLKDRGIDGLEHVFCRDGYVRNIYQSSIDKNPELKLQSTIEKLIKNKIKFDQLCYITNQQFPNKDIIVDKLYSKHKKPIGRGEVVRNWGL